MGPFFPRATKTITAPGPSWLPPPVTYYCLLSSYSGFTWWRRGSYARRMRKLPERGYGMPGMMTRGAGQEEKDWCVGDDEKGNEGGLLRPYQALQDSGLYNKLSPIYHFVSQNLHFKARRYVNKIQSELCTSAWNRMILVAVSKKLVVQKRDAAGGKRSILWQEQQNEEVINLPQLYKKMETLPRFCSTTRLHHFYVVQLESSCQ